MNDPLSTQREEDVIAFLDQIESKMGKANIDGLVGKLKMKHIKFITALRLKVIDLVSFLTVCAAPIKMLILFGP